MYKLMDNLIINKQIFHSMFIFILFFIHKFHHQTVNINNPIQYLTFQHVLLHLLFFLFIIINFLIFKNNQNIKEKFS